MRLIVAGSRTIQDYAVVWDSIDRVIRMYGMPTEIVSGTARGVDSLGERWAEEHKVAVHRFPADWDRFGRSAGYKQSVQMAEYAAAAPDGTLLAIWDGTSRGTLSMIQIAERMGLRIERVLPPPMPIGG
jgi:hypothetical protein